MSLNTFADQLKTKSFRTSHALRNSDDLERVLEAPREAEQRKVSFSDSDMAVQVHGSRAGEKGQVSKDANREPSGGGFIA